MAPLRGFAAAFFAAGSIAALAGCAGAPGGALPGSGSGPPADAPAYRVGDRWVYHGDDGFRVKTEWDETHEVTAIGAEGITTRFTLTGGVALTRAELWAAPGQVKIGAVYDNVTRRFDVPLQRYDFPLAPGKVWNQWVWNYNEFTKERGQINRYVRVSGWEKVTTPAGTFDALKMQVVMRLDDETFWRWPTTCNYAVWYAPAVKAVVREERNAQYVEKSTDSSGGAGTIRTQFGVVELISFTPGR
jgi:hypothetical protein